MAATPSPELKELWLSAVLAPGEEDPRQSCLRELSEYTGQPRDRVEELCLRAVDDQRTLWETGDRSTTDGLVDFYNRCDAYIYELLWWHALQQGDAPAWNARLVDIARQHGCRRFLDYGGGIGTNAILLAGEGLDVTVADISDVLQEFVRWRLDRRGIAGRTLDLKSHRLERESYDLISAVDVLEHVADPLQTLVEIREALVPGGILVFDLIASKPDPERPFHLMRSKYPIRSRLRGLGFRRLETFQKYLVVQKVSRGWLGPGVLAWDVLRWRAYYLLQGQWPKVPRVTPADSTISPDDLPSRRGAPS